MNLHVLTWNIHKGFTPFTQRIMIHELRARLHTAAPDIIFLQEVQGQQLRHAAQLADWPELPQHEFLAQGRWAAAYGRNAVYKHGHHGNAILSRYAIVSEHNQDITHWRFERRGLLHCAIAVPELAQALHCVCVHLSLFAHSRERQVDALAARLEEWVPHDEPLLIAGDFNDWRNGAGRRLAARLKLQEVFSTPVPARPVRSYPCALPLLRLDRIYVRGFQVDAVTVHSGAAWAALSDHAALSARLSIP